MPLRTHTPSPHICSTVDNQHNFSDVLGGAFLGTMISLVYVLRALPRYRRVLSPDSLSDPTDTPATPAPV